MAKSLLLVEGANDRHVILAIQGQRDVRILDKDQIIDCLDSGRLLTGFPVRLKESDITRLGIVMDADSNLVNRWAELRTILVSAGYTNIPQDPSPQGTVIEKPPESILPRVGIWLMPDNKSPGILENFLKFLVPANCPLITYAQGVLSNLPEKRYSAVAGPKALIHTWLAWQADPGRPLGQAITAKFLDHTVPEVDVFMDWLHKLFVE